MQDLNFRRDATQQTIDRFKPKPYALGKGDCARMIATHIRNMGRPIIALSKVKNYTTLVGAVRALKDATGHDNLLDAMSEHFPEQAPAACLIGDIVAVNSELPIGALSVYVGNGAVFAYEAENDFPIFGRLVEPIKAWRII